LFSKTAWDIAQAGTSHTRTDKHMTIVLAVQRLNTYIP